MADRSIARRYARAFFELAEEVDQVAQVGNELTSALDGLRSHDGELFAALSNPVFTLAERRDVLEQVVPRLNVGYLARNLLFVLLEKGRFRLLPEVVELYNGYADEKAGRARVLVETAEPLTPQLETEVIAALQQVTGKHVLIETRVDPSLIGGMIARVGGTVYDASVRTRLQNIKQRLLSAATPAEA
ncbi:MAG: ATP synthase F1 subunit delta [Deltaproteobacteria bacterium]|nr:ATP synthase F1 subunit delta [Deltaproteobacteria bacterium]MBW2253985.1 ATP synthase F1 subunit delta [Deltaproteobacteria bacterium]